MSQYTPTLPTFQFSASVKGQKKQGGPKDGARKYRKKPGPPHISSAIHAIIHPRSAYAKCIQIFMPTNIYIYVHMHAYVSVHFSQIGRRKRLGLVLHLRTRLDYREA